MISELIKVFKVIGMTVVDDTRPESEYGRSDGHIVVNSFGKYFKIAYSADSYGDDISIHSTKEVFPQQVTKTEYL